MSMYKILSYDEPGYAKVFSYLSWRVALLNYIDELELQNIHYVECHQNTDEVFILLEGTCSLIFAVTNDQQEVVEYEIINLEKNKIYVVNQGVYHTHILSKDAKVVVIEQEDTSYENSHRIYLDEKEKSKLVNFINGV